jgi:hypothetical protein
MSSEELYMSQDHTTTEYLSFAKMLSGNETREFGV